MSIRYFQRQGTYFLNIEYWSIGFPSSHITLPCTSIRQQYLQNPTSPKSKRARDLRSFPCLCIMSIPGCFLKRLITPHVSSYTPVVPHHIDESSKPTPSPLLQVSFSAVVAKTIGYLYVPVRRPKAYYLRSARAIVSHVRYHPPSVPSSNQSKPSLKVTFTPSTNLGDRETNPDLSACLLNVLNRHNLCSALPFNESASVLDLDLLHTTELFHTSSL